MAEDGRPRKDADSKETSSSSSSSTSKEWYKTGSGRGYMREKRRKLQIQFRERARRRDDADDPDANFLEGCHVWVDGYCRLRSNDELMNMVLDAGGHWYPTPSSKVTHVVVDNLPLSKVQQLRKAKLNAVKTYVSSQWLIDSCEAKRKLPAGKYVPEQLQIKGQVRIEDAMATDGGSTVTPTRRHGWAGPNPTLRSTRSDKNFVKNYFKKSRLHFIGSWRSQLSVLVATARRVRSSACRDTLLQVRPAPTATRTTTVVVMHVDMDCFFAQVALLRESDAVRSEPVVVAHGGNDISKSRNGRGSEISCANYPARRFGIRAGMGVVSAQKLCPNLRVLNYRFEETLRISKLFYETLIELCPGDVQPLSIDEAFVSFPVELGQDGNFSERVHNLMTRIRDRVKTRTGCVCSIGAALRSSVMAKLATSSAKPDGQFFVENAREFVATKSLSSLPGIGRSTARALKKHGYTHCAQIQDAGKSVRTKLQQWFGPQRGLHIWSCALGLIEGELKDILSSAETNDSDVSNATDGSISSDVGSVGAEVNWGVRFEKHENSLVEEFILRVAEEVEERLDNVKRAAGSITVKVMVRRKDAPPSWRPRDPFLFLGHGYCRSKTTSTTCNSPINRADDIARVAKALYRNLRVPPEDLRGFGIQATRLSTSSNASYARQSANAMASWLTTATSPNADESNVTVNERESDIVNMTPVRATRVVDDGSHGASNNVVVMDADAHVVHSTPPSWSCSTCAFRNSGFLQECEMCSKRRNETMTSSKSPSVLTSTPPNWSCAQCRFENSGFLTECEMCGGTTQQVRSSADPSASVPPSTPPSWMCASCKFMNNGFLRQCEMCDSVRSVSPKPHVTRSSRSTRNRVGLMKGRRRKRPRQSGNLQVTLTQLDPSRTRNVHARRQPATADANQLSMTQIDPAVFDALPSDMQREIKSSVRPSRRRQGGREASTRERRRRTQRRVEVPHVMSWTDVRDEFRNVKSKWMTAKDEELDGIASRCHDMTTSLVHARDLEGASSLMRHLERRFDQLAATLSSDACDDRIRSFCTLLRSSQHAILSCVRSAYGGGSLVWE